MDVIVPLAGPDFVAPDGSVKALIPFDGDPLLWRILKSRPWAAAANYTFVLRDTAETKAFAAEHLDSWFPGAVQLFLSTATRGAACSALVGVACRSEQHQPLVVDLADIFYSSSLDVITRLERSPSCGGLALAFKSANPLYSYLRCEQENKVVEAAEKRVISAYASAGTYIFRDGATYMHAISHAFTNESSQAYNNLFYLCPLFNGVLAQGMDVELEPVYDVIDIKIMANSSVDSA